MNDKSHLWHLEGIDLYDLLCPTKIQTVDDSQTNHTYSKGEFIYFPEEPVQYIYMISEGRVKIGSYNEDGAEVVKSILTVGEVFGELALAGEEIRTDFAQALDSNTSVCPMTVDEMKNLMANNSELSLKMYKLLGFRLRKLERKVESLVFKDARTRVIEFLLDAAAWKGKKVGFETMIPTRLTHRDIAQLTGTSRQTVTTILNDLKEQNIINFNRRQILIRDLNLLK